MTLSLFDDAPAAPRPEPVNTAPWKTYGGVALYLGDNIPILRAMPPNCVDGSVTDPPYGIGFMGKEWDTFDPSAVADNSRKAFQVCAGRLRDHENPNLRNRSRSPALSPSNVEYDRSLAGQHGFMRWCEAWAREVFRVLKPGAHLAVCGAPRSAHRMVSGIEDAGFEIRDSIPWLFGQGFPKSHNLEGGYGTALKPAHEPICIARKPLDGTVEENFAKWGVGPLNIDRCRLEGPRDDEREPEIGRWPPNVALDEEAAAMLDAVAGDRPVGACPTRRGSPKFERIFQRFQGSDTCIPARGANAGGPSRFFFCPKPSRLERDFGCEDLRVMTPGECTDRVDGSAGITPYAGAGRSGGGRNFHPTVKPVNLMRWLNWLVVPPGGVVLDPFLGSGTTGMAAVVDGYRFIGIERELSYLEQLADRRIAAVWREVTAA